MTSKIDAGEFMDSLAERTPGEDEFHQAVREVLHSVLPLVNDTAAYREARILERLVEPDRIVSFRVAWADDECGVHVNRGYRVQFSNAIGPYKGGLRFHPSVNQSVLKFLGFEQIFKNALTGLPMGGGKGGSDFNPKGRSRNEIMRFCQSFMTELYRHIGPDVDVPAGDIGVGEDEIGFMFGQYKRITNSFVGALTGKGVEFGGSRARPEATGFGLVYFIEEMLKTQDDAVEGKRVVISGAGNVATHAALKLIHRGAVPITLSDSDGFLYDEEGFDEEKLEQIRAIKHDGGSLKDYGGGQFTDGEAPWSVECDIALPCATQNEMDGDAAKTLIDNGCMLIAEGANMPLTADAVEAVRKADILYAPGKASNSGGVAMSGLEISQNAARLHRNPDDMRKELRQIMTEVHDACVEDGGNGEKVDYVRGANVHGFRKVANAMLAFGVV